jgi:very-short-patch-repair endonuclease
VKPRIPLPPSLTDTAFTYRQGTDEGLGRHRLRGPDLQRPFQGVILPAAHEAGFLTLCRALAQRLPADAFFCGSTAARVMGIPLPSRLEGETPFHVAVVAPGFPPSGRGIRGHMLQIDEGRIRSWAGIRISSPEQTWCDLGPMLTISELVAAGDYLIHWESPVTTHESLADAVALRKNYRGVVKLRHAVARLNDRSESPQESRLRLILEDAGLPGLEANYAIRTSGGFSYRADLAFPRRRLIVEYQSAFHETPERFRADMTRVSRLEADDWKVMQVNKDDIATQVELVTRVDRMLRTRPYFN